MPYESDHSVKDDWYAALDGGINDSVVSIVIDGAGAGDEPDTPFYANIDNEQIEVTDVAADTPSAGHSTLTVVRGVGVQARRHMPMMRRLNKIFTPSS